MFIKRNIFAFFSFLLLVTKTGFQDIAQYLWAKGNYPRDGPDISPSLSYFQEITQRLRYSPKRYRPEDSGLYISCTEIAEFLVGKPPNSSGD